MITRVVEIIYKTHCEHQNLKYMYIYTHRYIIYMHCRATRYKPNFRICFSTITILQVIVHNTFPNLIWEVEWFIHHFTILHFTIKCMYLPMNLVFDVKRIQYESRHLLQPPKYLIIIDNRLSYANNHFNKNRYTIPLDVNNMLGPHKCNLHATIGHHGLSSVCQRLWKNVIL